MVREFDLNIEKILENWEVYHAIREIIANALDEQTITQTSSIKIEQTPDGWWHIIDYGRGLAKEESAGISADYIDRNFYFYLMRDFIWKSIWFDRNIT